MDLTKNIKKSVYINGPINRDTYQTFLNQVNEYVTDVTPEPLLVFITSGGGSTYTGMAFYDLLRILPFEVITIAIGYVDSAAILPFMAGSKRFITPQTSFTFHLPSSSQNDRLVLTEHIQSAEDLKIILKDTQRLFLKEHPVR